MDPVLNRMLETEAQVYPTKFGFLKTQRYVTKHDRKIAVLRLKTLHNKVKSAPDVFSLSVAILDKFLTCIMISRRDLQLFSLVSYWIASKFDDTETCVAVSDLIEFSCYAYTVPDFIDTEMVVLETINFNCIIPTPYNFLTHFAHVLDDISDDVVALAVNHAHCMLAEFDMKKYRPSELAAASLWLAAETLNFHAPWINALCMYSRLKKNRLSMCVTDIRDTFNKI